MKSNRRQFITGAGVLATAGLAGCTSGSSTDGDGSGSGDDDSSTTSPTSGGQDTVKAAFVYDGQVGDQGWIFSHDRSRKIIDEEYDWLETTFQEEVTPEESERVMTGYVNQGYDLIFTTSVSFAEATLSAAQDNPDTYFENANSFETRENLSRYGAAPYEGRYCIGIAAGMMTETDTLGFLAGFPIPLSFRDMNAFILGARSVNPDATLKVQYMNEWYDPQGAKTAVDNLTSQGVDAIACNLDSTATVQAANDAGAWGSGAHSSMREAGGEGYLATPIETWEAYYGKRAVAVKEGTWSESSVWQGLADGLVSLDEFGPAVSEEAKTKALEARDQIKAGELDVWEGTKFEGWSTEVGGEVETEMTSYVEGIEGSPPSS
jgi:basic membrane protein A